MAKSPLRYPGGKSRAISRIMPQIPLDIEEFREPFVGGGSVFLAVRALFKRQIKRYWINDLNHDLICFWRVAQSNMDELVKAIRAVKTRYADNGRELFAYYQEDASRWTEFDLAVRFFVLNRITFSGVVDSGGYSQQAFERRFTDSSIERLQKLAYHLQRVEITEGDYQTLLDADGQNVFIFLDPPYWRATQSKLYGKRGDLHTNFDHERFANAMRACHHRWLITYDDSLLIRQLFSFATIEPWELQYGMNNYKQGKARKGREVFIKNY
ncbi:MAG: modification methylase [Phototrophicales bacterium]|nr:MAG: modification methylase [Phototrophicales bacterium]RMG74955.1 MAG: DNA adenine methylase [Chloroflexota bacterium]